MPKRSYFWRHMLHGETGGIHAESRSGTLRGEQELNVRTKQLPRASEFDATRRSGATCESFRLPDSSAGVTITSMTPHRDRLCFYATDVAVCTLLMSLSTPGARKFTAFCAHPCLASHQVPYGCACRVATGVAFSVGALY